MSRTFSGIEYKRTVSLDHGAAVMEVSTRSLAREFPAAEADAVNSFYRQVADDPVTVRAPPAADPSSPARH